MSSHLEKGKAKTQCNGGSSSPPLSSRPPSVPSFAAPRLRMLPHLVIAQLHHQQPAHLRQVGRPLSLTAGTATALKSIVGPMCAGHTGFVSTSAGRKSRPFTSYTGYANPGVSGISSLLYSTGFTARQILSGWAQAAACQVLVIWVPPLPPSCKT